jgi:folylpolyglutamate synthase/dihydropteroate synthase
MADKDVAGVVAAACRARALAGATVVCTTLDLPRALPAEALAAAWRTAAPGAVIRVESEPDEALDVALATGSGPVIVAGSLYLAGMARSRLVDDPALRDPDPS